MGNKSSRSFLGTFLRAWLGFTVGTVIGAVLGLILGATVSVSAGVVVFALAAGIGFLVTIINLVRLARSFAGRLDV